ncbi:MAG: hypothetical protein LT071_00785 [Nocardioides sp.]|nr:hypothetical protein [Nocardioides sp.]
MITLSHDLESIHHDLGHRLALAATARPDPLHPRGHYTAIDTFLAVASRHNAAMVDAIAPLVRGLPEGHDLAHDYLLASRAYEHTLNQVKAKLYGSTFVVNRPWPSVWSDVRECFASVCDLERRLADALRSETAGPDEPAPEDEDLSARLHHAELRAPTRPHPHIPHQGLPGRMARMVARRVDRFWDSAEGRMVPEPVRHHDREHQGPLTQYLLADPHLDS